jgi:hypothetical protein
MSFSFHRLLALLCCCADLYSPCPFADSLCFSIAALPSADTLRSAPGVAALLVLSKRTLFVGQLRVWEEFFFPTDLLRNTHSLRVLPSFSFVRMPFAQHNRGFGHFFSAASSSSREAMVGSALSRASTFRFDLGICGAIIVSGSCACPSHLWISRVLTSSSSLGISSSHRLIHKFCL